MSSSQVVSGKTVLITGGARGGLGRAMAEALAAAGASVIVTSRRVKAPRGATPESDRWQGDVTEHPLDVTDEKSVRRVFKFIDQRFGRLDALVNNAGVGVFKPITKVSLEEWNEVVATNLTGTFLCCREAFSRMKAQGGGRIVNIGSVADHVPLADNSAYGASKWGVRGLSAILNEEGKRHGVRVSHVSLGATFTEIWKGRKGFSPRDMLEPADVAQAIVDILKQPLRVRIDELSLLPPKGVL